MEDRLPPVPDQKTLVLVNTFVVHTTQFLNRFAALSENKLADINRRIHRIDAALALLEAKLRSAEQQLGGRAPTPTNEREPAGMVDDRSTLESGAGIDSQGHNDTSQARPGGFLSIDHVSSSAPSLEESSDKQTKLKVSEHPDYARFFKMLAVGVPSQAVAVKMRTEGLNPAFLETPNEPFPDAPT
ncbi:hypothetical protein KFL_000180630 [Klebsormidium nitens]|uniref:WASH complex subunit CCDC53 n=1 Tax=Klebsormidium nitens TaxID=105231 RepID=A0A1Y1HP79_KLENI|nr:hypothetical protein KFL_000180630 [Klebsormidium nitens]|eukprot:GAQ78781.1 hypothetical protein KFL_000180630 [Klebsormidium nitens]